MGSTASLGTCWRHQACCLFFLLLLLRFFLGLVVVLVGCGAGIVEDEEAALGAFVSRAGGCRAAGLRRLARWPLFDRAAVPCCSCCCVSFSTDADGAAGAEESPVTAGGTNDDDAAAGLRFGTWSASEGPDCRCPRRRLLLFRLL